MSHILLQRPRKSAKMNLQALKFKKMQGPVLKDKQEDTTSDIKETFVWQWIDII